MLNRSLPCLALAALVSLSAGVAVAQEVTLKVHHFLPAGSPAQTVLMEPWAEKVMAESQGRIKVEIYPSMQLGGKPPQLFDQARDGVVDVVWTLPGYTAGRFPIAEVFELPFVAASAEATSQAAQAFADKYLQEEFSQVHVLLVHTPAPGKFHLTERPVTNMEDLQGLKLRTPARTVTEALSALGATPLGMPVPEVAQAMTTGVIDGALLPWEVALPLRLHEIAKYHTEYEGAHGFYTSVFLFAMNKAKYASLPDDLKQVIDANSGQALAAQVGRGWDEAEATARAAAVARGNEITVLPQAEIERWQQATQPVIAAWVKAMDERGLNGQQMLDEARALIAQYSAP